MKKNIKVFLYITIVGILTVNCSNPQKFNANKVTEDTTFTSFLGKIEDLKLPFHFEINSDSVLNYIETTYGNGKYEPNKRFIIINKGDYKFLKDKYSIDSKYLYKSLFKQKIGKNYVVLITQNDLNSLDFYWFKLNSYTLSGKLIDTLTVAGTLPFGVNLSCLIDNHFFIETKADVPVPNSEEKTDSIPALFIYKTYELKNDGYFKEIKSENLYGHYYLIQNTNKYEFRK